MDLFPCVICVRQRCKKSGLPREMPVTENTWTDGHLSLLVIKDIDDDVMSDKMEDLTVKVFFTGF